ncbi:MAG: cytochrome P450, partial [Pseudolysinimonas sp.]
MLADQLGAYDRMRDTCPVAHSEYLGWSVFRHRDVVAIAEDVQHFSSQVSSRHAAVPNGFDPPQHGRYRAVVDRYFGPDDMAGLEPRLRTIANELIYGLLGEGEAEVEFIDRFALSYAVRAQRAWLNWPVHMETELRAWMTRNRRAVLAGDRPQLDEVARDFDAAVRRVVSERRAIPPPPDDVTGRLI